MKWWANGDDWNDKNTLQKSFWSMNVPILLFKTRKQWLCMQLNIDEMKNPLVEKQKWSNGFAVNYLWGETGEQRGADSAEPSTPRFFLCKRYLSLSLLKSGRCGFDQSWIKRPVKKKATLAGLEIKRHATFIKYLQTHFARSPVTASCTCSTVGMQTKNARRGSHDLWPHLASSWHLTSR